MDACFHEISSEDQRNHCFLRSFLSCICSWENGEEHVLTEADRIRTKTNAGELYSKELIDSDPVDSLAWLLSEFHNDAAPLGWTRYRGLASLILSSDEFQKRYERGRHALEES